MIVVNYSTESYKKGQQRLFTSLLNSFGNLICKSLMLDKLPDGSPSHKESPYEFKIHCVEKGFEFDDIVLWADSSMWCVGDITKIENIIKQDGYFFEEAGHYVDTWCNDHTRRYFKLEQGNRYKMFSAGLVGFNLKSELAMEFLYKWKESARAGCFKGDWSNHRHDMTCGSIIAERLNMKYQTGGSHLAYVGPGYQEPNKDVVFYAQGI
jgi:hypothetical protein